MLFNNSKIIKIKNLGKYAIIDWTLGNYCNYHCPYCFPDCNTGSVRTPKISDSVKNNIKYLVDQMQKITNKKIFFNLAGGEPTIYHDIENLLTFLNKLGPVSIVTNGSRSIRWWNDYADKFDQVSISFHINEGNVEHIVELIKTIYTKTHIKLFIMIDDKKFKECENVFYEFYRAFNDYNITLGLKLLRSSKGNIINYSEEQKFAIYNMKKFEKLTPRHGKPGLFKSFITTEDNKIKRLQSSDFVGFIGTFKNYSCNAPQNFLQIDYNGNIGMMSCGEKFHNATNIFDEKFTDKFVMPKESVVCSTGQCNCMGLLLSSKIVT